MRSGLVALLIACIAWPSPAAAEPAAPRADALARARTHFEAGRSLFTLGNYTDAIREFSAGYAEVPRPEFLINIGQSYRRLHEHDKARAMFAKYLASVPAADPRRAEVQRWVDELDVAPPSSQHEVAAPGATAPAALPTAPPARAPRPSDTAPVPSGAATKKDAGAPRRDGRALVWGGATVASVGGALALSGAVLAGLAHAGADQLDHPAAGTRFDPALESRIGMEQSLAIAFLSVGGAALVAGTVLAVVGRRREQAGTGAAGRVRRVALAVQW